MDTSIFCSLSRHEIRGPRDKLSTGGCRACANDRQRAHRAKIARALVLLDSLQDAGVHVDGRAFDECLEFLVAQPGWRFDHLAQRRPDLLEAVLAKVDEIASVAPVLAARVAAR